MKDLVNNIIAYAVQRDVNAVQLCKLSGIPPAFLKKQDIVVTPPQLHHLWKNAAHLTNDLLFSLHMGESLRAGALGIVGNIIQSSATVGEALTHAAALVHLFTNQVTMQIKQEKQAISIVLLPTGQTSSAHDLHTLMELLMVITIHELDGLMLKKIVPTAVFLPYKVSEPEEYERVLRCRPAKSNGKFGITIPGQLWDEPILTANYELQELFLQKIKHLAKPTTGNSTLQTRIYNYLLANAYLGISSLNDMAANFNTSPRNLQRQLKKEGSTFQLIADEVKRSLAEQYIASGNFELKDISWMLGYNELSAFSRAFKRWTGKAPTMVKYNHLHPPL